MVHTTPSFSLLTSEFFIAIHLLSRLLLGGWLAALVVDLVAWVLACHLLGLDLILLSCGHLLLHDVLLLLLHVELLLVLVRGLISTLVVVHHLLMVVVVLLVRLVNHPTLLLLSNLEISVLGFFDFPIDALDFKLVGMDLCLVVLKLSYQLFELLPALFQVRLVLAQLLGHVGSALLR